MTHSFGELLRQFRVRASLTQEALAERCRISPATIAAIEQGRRTAPRLSTVLLIAEALDLPHADRAALAEAAHGGGPAPERGQDTDQPGRAGAPGRRGDRNRQATIAGLPIAWTSFIGREQEQEAILAALAAGHRVVSLLGPGGVGKTRLAVRTAESASGQYPSGTVFVDLVPVREGFLSQAVATLLGVTEGPGRSLDAALSEHLAHGRRLVVLDNCEHLLPATAAFIEKLLADCADLTVLTTSRERLAIPGERVITIPPLPLAGDGRPGRAASDAEALFVDRALAGDPEFAASPDIIAEICARLDGVPLAIEIAAARSASLGLDGLLAGLDDHLRLLAGSRRAAERHRSLRAVIDWSHDLLDGDERLVFRRVGIFAGGFDLDAAAPVSGIADRGLVADLLGRLTDKSLLVHRREPAGSRWHMLETIRAYATDRLAQDEDASGVLAAHLGWAAATAESLERLAESGQPWRPVFDAVADDLRAAADRSPGQAPGAGDISHGLARTLGHLAYARRFLTESRERYRSAASRALDPDLAAEDLRSAASVAMAEGHGTIAFGLLLDSAALAKAAGNGAGEATAIAYAATIADRFAAQFSEEIAHDRLRGLVGDARAACPPGDIVAAAYVAAAAAWTAGPEKTVPDPALAADALAAARLTGDPVLISGALDAVVGALDTGGRLRDAHRANAERGELLGSLPRHEPRAGIEIIDAIHMLTEIAVTAGDLPGALAAARLAEGDDIASGQPHMTASKPVLPLVLQGRFDEAREHATLMWESWVQAGRPAARWMGPAVYGMVLSCGLRGDDDGRRDWLARIGELLGARPELVSGANLAVVAAFTQARIALHQGDLNAADAAAAGLPLASRPWYQSPHWYSLRPYAWAIAAEVAVIAGSADAADRVAAAGPAGDENLWANACLARAAGRLNGDRAALVRSVGGWEHIGARFERACTLLLLPDRAAEGRAELRALRCPQPAAWPERSD
jgi:predicted ATPase/transcriptional regulator with XRE-family HTH domain